jgi:SAM-dependent methyltransferase
MAGSSHLPWNPTKPPTVKITESNRVVTLMRKTTLHLLAALFVGAIVVLSPFLLDLMADAKHDDWAAAGNIGQAYGAASAILSALALLGIAGSMALQLREHTANRAQIVRNQQFELLRQIQQDPELLGPITGHDVARDGADLSRQLLHAAMWINWAKTAYVLNEIPQVALRDEMFPGLFSNEVGQERWRRAREIMESHYPKGRAREFFTIGDEEYEKAIARDAAPLVFPTRTRSRRRPSMAATAAAATLGLAVGYRLRDRATIR